MTSVDLIFGRPHSVGLAPSGARTDGARTDLDIGDLFEAVASRWRLSFVALALTLSLAGLYLLVTPARYAATMSFLVDNREHATAGDSAPTAQSADSPLVENQMRLLTSNTVLRKAVEHLQLQHDPEFGAAPGLFGAVKSLVFGAPARIDPSVEQVTETLAHSITVKRADKSYVIDVEAHAASPDKAEQIAQALASAFLATQAQFSASMAEKEGKWLDIKIEDLHKRLEQAELRIQDYRQAQSVVVTDGLTPSDQQIKNADAALVEARGKRAEAEAIFSQVQAATQAGSIETSKEAIRSPLLEKMLGDLSFLSREAANMQSTLGPRHPAYIANQSQLAAQRAQIMREMRNILETQRRNVIAARNVERAAEAQVVELSKSINDNGGKRLELGELERQAVVLRDNYAKALAARENTHAEVISSPNPLLINQPIAQGARISPKTLPALLIAITAGINLWIAAALTLEFLARRKAAAAATAPLPDVAPPSGAEKTQEIANLREGPESLDEAPLLISLPSFHRAGGEKAEDRSGVESATLARAIRAMDSARDPYRRAVARLYECLPFDCALYGSPPIFAVSASREKAGGSTLALSLALAACDQGDRVLVVDCNAEHPTLASLLPYLTPIEQSGAPTLKMFACRRDARTGGQILLGSFNRGEPTLLKAQLDLILLDCGPRNALPASMAAKLTGMIEIDRDRDGGQRRARLTLQAP